VVTDRLNRNLSLVCWKKRRLISETNLKWRLTGGSRLEGVVGVFNPCEVLTPVSGVVGGQTAESRFELLVHSLCLTVGLWMITGSK